MIASITAEAAQSLAKGGSLQLVDGTWQMPGDEPVRGTLSGTTVCVSTDDLKALAHDTRARQSKDVFARDGISGERPVSVYDRAGFFSAPWVAWMLASNGHAVSLVTGWGDEGVLAKSDPAGAFSASDPYAMNATKDNVLAALGTETQIVDARSPGRFTGSEPEPRKECRSGHIPGSFNVHYRTLLNGGGYRDIEDIAEVFARAGIDRTQPVITTCGSGITASLVAVALKRAGVEDVRVYQGSWAEWGMDPDLPIETGS